MVLFNGRKLIGLALILMIAFPPVAFATEKKGAGHKNSVSRSSAKNMPQKHDRSPKVCKPLKISHKNSVHHSSIKNVQQKGDRSRNDCKLKAKNPKNLAQFSSNKNYKGKGDRPKKVYKPVDEIRSPNLVQYSPTKNSQQKGYRPSLVSKPARYVSSAERMTPDHGSGNDVAAIKSTIGNNSEGKSNNQEFFTILNNNDLAEQTISNSPDIKQQGHITKDGPEKNGEVLANIIRITTPIADGINNR
jgi:hypothetical protein